LTTPDVEIVALAAAEITVTPWRWPFAHERRGDIDRHFAARQRERPALWNGKVLLLRDYAVDNGVLRGASFETDYASFLAWRDWGWPAAAGAFNVFAAAALQSADGAFLLGQMAPSTSIAGLWLFPCGTPDPKDIDGAGRLDLAGSLGRELLEETGLDVAALAVEPGWTMVHDGGLLALIKRAVAPEPGSELRARVTRYLAAEAQPEFSDVRIVRGRADLAAATPRFLVAYLDHVWRRETVDAAGARQ